MNTEDFNLTETADDLALAILEAYEREMFDDELVEDAPRVSHRAAHRPFNQIL